MTWCSACQMDSEHGCRHPLGPEYCPYRVRRLRRWLLEWSLMITGEWPDGLPAEM